MGKVNYTYGKIRYTSMGDNGYHVSCLLAGWIDNASLPDVKDDIQYDNSDRVDQHRRRKRDRKTSNRRGKKDS